MGGDEQSNRSVRTRRVKLGGTGRTHCMEGCDDRVCPSARQAAKAGLEDRPTANGHVQVLTDEGGNLAPATFLASRSLEDKKWY